MVYGVVRMDIEIDIISNGFFDCSLYFYEWKNFKKYWCVFYIFCNSIFL